MNEHVTALPEATQQAAPEAPAAATAARRRHGYLDKIKTIALGVGFPLVLVVCWHYAVAYTGTRLIPSPYDVGVMMYDFSFGGFMKTRSVQPS